MSRHRPVVARLSVRPSPWVVLVCACSWRLRSGNGSGFAGFGEVRSAPAANPTEAFVQDNIEQGYAILNSTTLSDEQRRSQFRDFMFSLTDARRIGMFTLGPYANSASKEDVESFINAFSEYAVAVYKSRLSKYKGRRSA